MPIKSFKNHKIRTIARVAACGLLFGIGHSSLAQTARINSSVGLSDTDFQIAYSGFDQFIPKQTMNSASLDYSVWDGALNDVVLRLGESIRIRARKPKAIVGSRFRSGHQTAYRLEGSRVTFSYLDDEYKKELSEYRDDLVNIANTYDISGFSRTEQLAFWFNLHNVTVIEQIAHNYPVKKPSELKIGSNGETLHEAKLFTIRNVPLSLRDIREKIVYKNWQDPDVIYGFFHGDIGGPAIQNYAITSENIDTVLSYQAKEFVNSLRGFHLNSDARKVSALYKEARPYYFQNWERDLESHLLKHSRPDVKAEIEENRPFEFDKYDKIVADLVGGSMPMPSYVGSSTDENFLSVRVPPEVARLMRELDDKVIKMRRRGMFNNRGTVIIEDIGKVEPNTPVIIDENEEGSSVGRLPDE